MSDIKSIEFHSLTHGKVTQTEIISLIKTFLQEQPKAEYTIVIGSDSQEYFNEKLQQKTIQIVTAIVIYRKGFGGKYFWQKKHVSNIHNLRQKVYAETLTSLEFAHSFVPMLQETLQGDVPNYLLEIHIDVGEFGETREMIKEVVGMVTGNGFIAKTKPYSYAASNIADKHT